MSAVWNKIDPGLATVYSDYLKLREGELESGMTVHHAADLGRVGVDVYFTTDLGELEALGFQPTWQEDENRVTGRIDLADLERFADHDGVRRIVFGRKGRPFLDRSVPNVRANLAWSRSDSTFRGATGAGAFVGVIDTGIDFRHPFFTRSRDPTRTRIRRIWDQGLVPRGREQSPAPSLLSGGPDTYGVEYTDFHIDAVLARTAGAMPVRHRDCGAHGTHVASIAAGNGGPDFTYVGVAPEAELIVVKFITLETVPTVRGAAVGELKQFKDAIAYIVNAATEITPPIGGKPVAINCSLGGSTGPHDGFTDLEDWLTDFFAHTTGAVFVVSAGNNGGMRQHARIEFPAGGGSVEIPLKLYDVRTNRRDHDRGRWEDSTGTLFVDVYYPQLLGVTLTGELDVPGDGHGYIAGPALGDRAVGHAFGGGQRYDMVHSQQNPPLRGGGAIHRNLFYASIIPYGDRHRVGAYKLRLTASGQLTAHLWCTQHAERYGFMVDTDPVPPLPANVSVVDEHQIGGEGGASNVVTVAAYNAEGAESAGDPIWEHSSRGPLVSYEPGPPQPAKPDLAAPGFKIDAAKSRDMRPAMPGPTYRASGTSTSAPHVTGAIALMLEKNRYLEPPRVIDILTRQGVRPRSDTESHDAVGAGRLDVKQAVDNTP